MSLFLIVACGDDDDVEVPPLIVDNSCAERCLRWEGCVGTGAGCRDLCRNWWKMYCTALPWCIQTAVEWENCESTYDENPCAPETVPVECREVLDKHQTCLCQHGHARCE